MKRTITAMVLTLVVSGLMTGSALAADFSGVWKGEVTLPTGQALPFVARLTQDGTRVTGTLDGIPAGAGADVEVRNGQVENDTLTFTGVRQVNDMPVEFRYTATFRDADTLHFAIVRTDGSAAPLESVTKRQ
jgi:hypothetical protein